MSQITNSINLQYSNLQKQHQEYANHLTRQLQDQQQQLQQLLQQQKTESIPPPGIQYSVMSSCYNNRRLSLSHHQVYNIIQLLTLNEVDARIY